ncbi:MAG: amino acid--tRNA ligase-related protein [Candidatus Andersenbacteria bacterium]
MLQLLAGGTMAKLVTHHDALDVDFMRIARSHLKRLVRRRHGTGLRDGKIFRTEGISPQHLQEFTEVEFYMAYASYEDLMELTEKMFTEVLQKTFGTLRFRYGEHELDFSCPWPRVDYFAAVEEACGIDLSKVRDVAALTKEIRARKLDVHIEKGVGYGHLVDNLYKATVRPSMIQPTFLVGHPIEVSPLAKRDADKPGRVERFQLVVAGFEVVNAYSELNDPHDQRARFAEQAKLREAGDDEAHVMDEDFVQALEYGLPPTAGWGMGVDRVLALVTNQANVRDVVLFPTLRPEGRTLQKQ